MGINVNYFLLSFFFCIHISVLGTQIMAVYHHQPSKQGTHGSLVFYCDTHPQITVTPLQSGRQKRYEVIFKNVSVSNTIKHLSRTCSATGYECDVKMKDDGVSVTISCDPNKFDLSVQTFSSIKQQYGIALTFFGLAIEQNSSKDPIIALDCGHGGADHGTVVDSIKEKDICLAVGKRVEQLLKEAGIAVHMVRSDDKTVLLDQRTYIAKECGADLLVSLHANTAPANSSANGVETFCLHRNLFSTVFGNASETMQEHLLNQTNLFAQKIHCGVISRLKEHKPEVVDRKLKHSVTQVLFGAGIPAALVEIGFLSHGAERKNLMDPSYQAQIAQGVVDGVLAYLKK